MFALSERSKRNRSEVDVRLIQISDLAITISLVDFGHGRVAGKRTAETQNQLFKEGKSKADGFEKLSEHQSGNALDFYAYVDGKASWDPEHLAMVAAAFLQAASTLGYRVKWGGLWKSSRSKLYGWDMPHIQLVE